ncbi:hypothetical protein AUJ68_02270 [Candidatus Woesearchaeota archaeon CG1_02_57_44]|nr:MAG: hypothetical protein AUJ68_02270 [Candidatus Woesearchaeota archaeon CG1_02_57_44]
MIGVLTHYKPFGDKFPGYWVIAAVVAFFTLYSPTVVGTITNMAPWFVMILMFFVFLIITYNLLGVEMDWIGQHVTATSGLKWAVFIIAVILFIMSISGSVGPKLAKGEVSGTSDNIGSVIYNDGTVATTQSQDFSQNVYAFFFHPKVLGMLFIMILAIATVGLMSSQKGAM